MRILLTRPAGQSKRSSARLSALGHETLVAPLIEIVALETNAPPARAGAVIATSAHAIKLVENDELFRRLPIYVVGEGAARAARARGWDKIETIAKDSRDLTTSLLACDAAINWLYLAGSPRLPDLERALDAAGRQVAVAIVYEARPVTAMPLRAAAAFRGGGIDVVLHYSARSAAIFVDLARRAGLEPQAASVLHVAISDRAATPLQGFAHALRVASRPDERGLLERLQSEA